MRSSELRKRFFLSKAKFDMNEFFNDKDDDAKILANVQAGFIYEPERRQDERPEETCQIRWTKFMNVLLPERQNRKVVEMVSFWRNQHEILNRNMPFMFKRTELKHNHARKAAPQTQFGGKLLRRKTYIEESGDEGPGEDEGKDGNEDEDKDDELEMVEGEVFLQLTKKQKAVSPPKVPFYSRLSPKRSKPATL